MTACMGAGPFAKPHWVYRYWASDGSLLYVGATANAEQRHYQHTMRTPWFHEIERRELIPYPDHDSAHHAERFLTLYGNPKYNVRHNFRPRVWKRSDWRARTPA